MKRNWIMLICVALAVTFFTGISEARVVTENVEYTHAGVNMKGYLAVDTSIEGARPGVLVVHQWKGLGEYEKRRARQLAGMGYVAFAADIYGADTRPSTNHEAAIASSTFRNDRHRYRERLYVALDVLREHDQVIPGDLAAIGYCFGGTGVLELVRSGADIDGIVSFHGGLTNPNPKNVENIQTRGQVHHGAEDPHVTRQDVLTFWKEMNGDVPGVDGSPVDWELHVYSNAVHGFTEKEAGSAYNERADRLSWQSMSRFFEEIFTD